MYAACLMWRNVFVFLGDKCCNLPCKLSSNSSTRCDTVLSEDAQSFTRSIHHFWPVDNDEIACYYSFITRSYTALGPMLQVGPAHGHVTSRRLDDSQSSNKWRRQAPDTSTVADTGRDRIRENNQDTCSMDSATRKVGLLLCKRSYEVHCVCAAHGAHLRGSAPV